MNFKILLTSSIPESCIERMRSIGWNVTYIPEANQEDIMDHIEGQDGIFINTKTIADSTLMEKGKELKFIGRIGSGLDIVDLECAKEKGIVVFNSPEGNRNAVAEHVIGMMLSFENKLIMADKAVRDRNWHREKYRGLEISGSKIGIIGFGNTGKALFKRLSGFDMHTLVYDPYVEAKGKDLEQVDSLATIAQKCDIISFHVQLTPETRSIGNADFFEKCINNPLIINTSRGGIIKLPDLMDALESRKVRGACLDVFENERPESYTAEEEMMYERLFARDDVLLSPHVAGWSVQSRAAIVDVLINKVLAHFLSNRAMRSN
jgi:D-3-phosphoglycerate dehydrogenase